MRWAGRLLGCAAYMTYMSTFDPAQHPRGHVNNPGGFSDKENSAPEGSLAVNTDVDVRSALAQIKMHARKYARRYRFSDSTREEIVQDTVLDLLAQQKRRGTASIDQPALLNAATRAVASRYIDPDAHHNDLTARRLLAKTVELEEAALGRPVTSKELAALADDVRLHAFNPGRRPHEDYYLGKPVYSLDFQVSETSGTTTGDLLVHEEPERPFSIDGSSLADTVDALESREVSALSVKRNAWNHIAGLSKAPHTHDGALNKADARSATAFAQAHGGGVAQLARDWQAGDTTEAQDRALFAAWGDPSMREREHIATALLRKPEYADELWASAVGIASRPLAAG